MCVGFLFFSFFFFFWLFVFCCFCLFVCLFFLTDTIFFSYKSRMQVKFVVSHVLERDYEIEDDWICNKYWHRVNVTNKEKEKKKKKHSSGALFLQKAGSMTRDCHRHLQQDTKRFISSTERKHPHILKTAIPSYLNKWGMQLIVEKMAACTLVRTESGIFTCWMACAKCHTDGNIYNTSSFETKEELQAWKES